MRNRRNMAFRLLVFLIPFFGVLLAEFNVARAASRLKLVLAISRHGVRPPYAPTGGNLSASSLAPYTPLDAPTTADAWGIDPVGQPLTPHGKLAVSSMGRWYRHLYPAAASSPCRDIAFYSDTASRDISTAKAFLSGLAPHCMNDVDIWTKNALELFNQGNYATATCGQPSKEIIESLFGASGDNFSAFNEMYSKQVDDINSVFKCCVDPSLCGKPAGSTCSLSDVPTKYAGEFWAPVSGPVPLAGYFGTFALLASLNNISLSWMGDSVTLERVVSWYPLSLNGVLNVADNSWASRSFASTLAMQILASLEQAVTGKRIDALLHGPNANFVYFAGHDTNLVLLRNLLGLNWLTKGWAANSPPPGSMISFELHEKDDGMHFVGIKFTAATPSQIRRAAAFSPNGETPGITSVALPGCDGATIETGPNGVDIECEYGAFKRAILDAIRVECVAVPELQAVARQLLQEDDAGGEDLPTWALGAILGSFGCVAVIVAIAAMIKRRRSNDERGNVGRPLLDGVVATDYRSSEQGAP